MFVLIIRPRWHCELCRVDERHYSYCKSLERRLIVVHHAFISYKNWKANFQHHEIHNKKFWFLRIRSSLWSLSECRAVAVAGARHVSIFFFFKESSPGYWDSRIQLRQSSCVSANSLEAVSARKHEQTLPFKVCAKPLFLADYEPATLKPHLMYLQPCAPCTSLGSISLPKETKAIQHGS